MKESKKYYAKEARHKIVPSVQFHISGILGQAKLTYSDRKHNSCLRPGLGRNDCQRAKGNLLGW